MPVTPAAERSASTGLSEDVYLLLAAWGAAGAVVAIRRFRWDPRPRP